MLCWTSLCHQVLDISSIYIYFPNPVLKILKIKANACKSMSVQGMLHFKHKISLWCNEVNLPHQCPHQSVLHFEMRLECSPHQPR